MNIGFGNVVNTDKIVAVIQPDSAPAKRMIQKAKEEEAARQAEEARKQAAAAAKADPCSDYYKCRIYRSFCITARYTDWQI